MREPECLRRLDDTGVLAGLLLELRDTGLQSFVLALVRRLVTGTVVAEARSHHVHGGPGDVDPLAAGRVGARVDVRAVLRAATQLGDRGAPGRVETACVDPAHQGVPF